MSTRGFDANPADTEAASGGYEGSSDDLVAAGAKPWVPLPVGLMYFCL